MGLKTIQAQDLIDGRQCISFQFQKLTRQHGQNQVYCEKRQSGQEVIHFHQKATQNPGRPTISATSAI